MSDYYGDIRLGDTHDFKFTTRQISGAPSTLGSSPVISAYPGNSTTELTGGITLTVDFDSRTGYNNIRVVATSGNSYATATNYDLAITTGTVNSVSVVGESVAAFSIENRSALMPATGARTLVVDASGLADANAVKVGPTGSGTAQTARDLGLALPAVAPNGAGGLLITAAGSLDMDEMNVDIEAIQTSTAGLTFTGAGKVDASVRDWVGDTIPARNVAGVPLIDLKYILGTLSPAAVGKVGIDWAQISNPTSAQNLSSTQIAGVNNLASGTDSINTTATNGSTITTGTQVAGTYASTSQLDGSYWQISDSAGTLDAYLEFQVGTYGVPTSGQINAGLTSAVNTLKVLAYNWAGASWDQVGTLLGLTTLSIAAQEYDFTTAHVGTGGNLGKVRLRFYNTGLTSANLYLDYAVCGYTIAQTFPTNFSALGITAGGAVSEVVLTDTLTTYTGNTPQTGDTYALANGANGFSAIKAETADIDAIVDLLPDGGALTSLASATNLAEANADLDELIVTIGVGGAGLYGVWDVAIAGHLGAGTTGLVLNSAGGAGDPWSTAVPGAYGAGTAGAILGALKVPAASPGVWSDPL